MREKKPNTFDSVDLILHTLPLRIWRPALHETFQIYKQTV